MSLTPVQKEELLHFLDNNGQVMDFQCGHFDDFTQNIVGCGILDNASYENPAYDEDEIDWLSEYLSKADEHDAIKLCLNLLEYYKKVYCGMCYHPFNEDEYNHLFKLFMHHKDYNVFSNYLLSNDVYEADKEIQYEVQELLKYSDDNPSDTVLHSTKLLEAIYKYILNYFKVPYNTGARKETLIQLNKKVCKQLGLYASDQHKTTIGRKASELLGNLSNVISVMSFFRDKFGSHGKAPNSNTIRLPKRYAILCLGSVAVITRFLMDTLEVRIQNR